MDGLKRADLFQEPSLIQSHETAIYEEETLIYKDRASINHARVRLHWKNTYIKRPTDMAGGQRGVALKGREERCQFIYIHIFL